MKILVYGAGVLGSLYAARLQKAGVSVCILARGKRLDEIREHGIVLVEQESGQRMTTFVHAVAKLQPEDDYDLVVVLVRKNQLPAVLESLADNHCVPTYLFMVNNAAGPGLLIDAIGRERIMLGFPGAGGIRCGHEIIYRQVSGHVQGAPIGELDGAFTPRLAAVLAVFNQSGLPTQNHPNIDAWLKNHVALVSPIANAIYAAGGDVHQLARMPVVLSWMVNAVREGLLVLNDLGVPITPARFHLLRFLPVPLLVGILRLAMDTKAAETVLAAHANAARDEMQVLANEFALLAAQSGRPTPAIDRLRRYLDPTVPPMKVQIQPAASARRWMVPLFGALVLLAGWLTIRRRKRNH